MEKLEFEIKGDETIIEEDRPFLIKVYGVIILVLLVIATSALFDGSFITFLVALVFSAISYLVYKLYSKELSKFEEDEKERLDKAKKIFRYFQKRYPILREFDNDKHINLDVTNEQSDESQDDLMFNIYMKVYKANADAIVLNSSNVSTSTYSKVETKGFGKNKYVKGSTRSEDTYYAMATFVKFK